MKCEFKNRKILLAGGTGFIGKRVTKFFYERGAEIFIISRKEHKSAENIKYIQADLVYRNSLQSVEMEDFDACIYMAANIPEIGQKKETFYEAKQSTLDPLVNFCDCVVGKIKHFVYISSIDVLGQCNKLFYDESQIPSIASPYGLAKYCGELYVKHYCETLGICWQSLRFSQVYGADEPIVRIIPIMKNALVFEKPFSLFTDGKEKRRFLFVDDAVEAIRCALLSGKNGIYNISGKDVCSMIELANTMEKVYEKKLNLSILKKVAGIDNVPSIEKAEQELGYNSKYSLEDGIRKMREEEKHEEYK